MANNDQKNTISKGTALAGTMKGTFTHSLTGEVSVFDTPNVTRETVNGNMDVEARMNVPGENQSRIVGFRILGENPASGTYVVGTPSVDRLFLRLPHGSLGDYHALEGGIQLQNHAPETRISGNVKFKTLHLGSHQYDVEMVFEVSGFF
jgi:hypothetical protein